MVTVRSVSTVTSMVLGRAACNCGSSALMLSTTSMTLAPGWRWTLRMTAGDGVHPGGELGVLRTGDDVATSERRTGAPFL